MALQVWQHRRKGDHPERKVAKDIQLLQDRYEHLLDRDVDAIIAECDVEGMDALEQAMSKTSPDGPPS